MILNEKDRSSLTYVMKVTLLDQCSQNPSYFGDNVQDITTFIKEEATYEQLLNLTFNSKRQETYLPAEVLESVASWVVLCQLENMIPEDNLSEMGSDILEGTILTEKDSAAAAAKKKWQQLSKWIRDQKKRNAARLRKHPGIKKYGKWITLSIAATTGAAFVYTKFLSDASKCKGKTGATYKACMKKVKITAQQEAVRALKMGMSTCSQFKDVAKCKVSYQKEIKKRQAAISKLRNS